MTKHIIKDKSNLIHAELMLTRFHNMLNITWTANSHEWAPGLIKKYIETSDKYKYWNLGNPELMSRVLNITDLRTVTQILTSGIRKMHKSHDQPLCAYLMLIFNHVKDLYPNDTYTKNFWTLMKKIDTKHWSIRKCMKYQKKYKYWSLTTPGTLSGESLKLIWLRK